MKGQVCSAHSRILAFTNIRIVYIQTYDDIAYYTATSQIQSIKSLSGKGVTSVSILSAADARPPGCVIFAVSASAAVFLHVKGRVDIDDEIQKASKKLDKTRILIERQRKILEGPAYVEKVSQELQEVEKKKLADLETERNGFEETIKQFETLKLE